jgi:VWFA-related protein
MRAFCRFWCLSCALLVLSLPLWAKEEPKYRIHIQSVEASGFPTVTVRFTILDQQTGQPATELPQADIIIAEDGKEVHRIKPQVLRRIPSATVLTVDTSGSMARDKKLDEAKRAAKGFFDRLAPQTQCGLVLFHHLIHTSLSLRKEREPLREQVESAEPFGGTAYHDAVLRALEMFPDKSDGAQRAIVLMTDGRDVNSSHTLMEAIREAQRRKVQVFTIGLGKKGRNEFTRTVLVLDRSGSMRENRKMENLKKAALGYLKLMPAEGADAAVISFNDRIDATDQFTANKEALRVHIDSLMPFGETALFDAACEGIDMLAAGGSGDERRPIRRTALVLTDGIDNRSRRSAGDLVRAARENNIRVFMLGLGPKGEIDERVMKRIARETGGEFIHIEDAAKLTEVFEELSITIHDDGIDEASLRRLAEQTGGEYFHVEEADKLRLKFEEVAHKLENTFTVTYKSRRTTHDGTLRGIQIDLVGKTGTGSDQVLSRGETAFATHGMISPRSDRMLYLALLGCLLALLAVPSLLLWRKPSSGS